MIKLKTNPGLNDPDDIMIPDYRLYRHMMKFMNDIKAPVADIGEDNAKSLHMSLLYDIDITQVTCRDFNFPKFSGKYKTVFCFEVLEHVQNPLSFMIAVQNLIEDDGVIYLSTPGRFRFLWSKHHFVEHTPSHWEKWLFKPLGLIVVKKKRVPIKIHWTWKYFIGIRPLLRLPFILFNYTWMYELRKTNPINITYNDLDN